MRGVPPRRCLSFARHATIRLLAISRFALVLLALEGTSTVTEIWPQIVLGQASERGQSCDHERSVEARAPP